MTHSLPLIKPDWPAPAHVQAFTTTRLGGTSQPPFDSLNLGAHVNDAISSVNENRHIIEQSTAMPASPLWLEQTHSTKVITSQTWQPGIEADAIYSNETGQVCTVLTADCLPLLLCDHTGQQIAAIHAGWRGLLSGVIENTLPYFNGENKNILVWLGPAIGPNQFEVGTEVYQAFVNKHQQAANAFIQTDADHYLANIYLLARQRLAQLGIHAVYGGEHCTVTDAEQFFSYRRDGVCGRMASVIWLATK